MTRDTTLLRDGTKRLLVTSISEMDVDDHEAIRLTRQKTDGIYRDEAVQYGDVDADSVRVFLKKTPASTHIYSSETIILPPTDQFHSSIRDLRPNQAWQADYLLDLLTFDIPTAALDRWARDVGIKSFGGLHYQNGVRGHDEIFQGFARCVLPYVDDPAKAPRLFLDYVLQSVCTYVSRRFGVAKAPPVHSGGLAPWQERRAKEMIAANLNAQISLKTLADECRLSISHFTKTFRQTVGQTPHQWLMEQRIDRAMGLMLCGDLALSDIATRCGFADQSHFTRAFTKRLGSAPGAWRRQRQRAVLTDMMA